jgi:glycosyltransferase involved in cell wall biosynthesis
MGAQSDSDFTSYPQPLETVLRGLWPRVWSIESKWSARLSEVVRDSQPDVVLTQQTVIVPTIEVCKRNGIPVVVFLQNVDPFCLGSFWSGSPWKCKYRCIGCKDAGPRLSQYPFFLSHIRRFGHYISSVDAVVTNSEFLRRTLMEIFGVESTVVTPLTKFVGPDAALNRSGKILFFSPVDYKGVDTALGIAGLMKDEKFIFVGNAKSRTVTKMRRHNNVEYVSWLEDPTRVYGEAKLLIVPSVIPEGYGMVCVEAMSRGVPCVVSGVGALPETVGLGGDTVSPHRDVAAWVNVLKRYSAEEYLLEKSKLALAESRKYSPQISVESFNAVLKGIAERTPFKMRVP